MGKTVTSQITRQDMSGDGLHAVSVSSRPVGCTTSIRAVVKSELKVEAHLRMGRTNRGRRSMCPGWETRVKAVCVTGSASSARFKSPAATSFGGGRVSVVPCSASARAPLSRLASAVEAPS